jgi:hypothetical protein
MIYNVITPLNRFENFNAMNLMLAEHDVRWHVITDADAKYHVKSFHQWVWPFIAHNSEGTFFERCNRSINLWMDEHAWVDEDFYCILNDDDAYEPGFFDKIRKYADADIIVPSMMRGARIPAGVAPERAHGTDTLVADPANMQVGRIGVEQMIVRGRILKNCRLPLTIAGDGEMLTYIAATNPGKVVYAPEANVWFNYLEPGRWNELIEVKKP